MNEKKKRRILVVDDDPSLLETLVDVLGEIGYEVDGVSGPEDAIRRCEESGYDIIILDIRMPGMNGVELSKRISELRSDARIIMMSAYGMDERIAEAMRRGALAFLQKPFDIKEVTELIDTVEKRTILIVDDDTVFSQTMKDLFEEKGCVVDTAAEGSEAIELVRRRRYDLILLDMKLPKANGLEVYLSLKEIAPYPAVIMMTAYDECEELAKEAVKRNAYTYLKKPFDIDELLSIAHEIFRQQREGGVVKPS